MRAVVGRFTNDPSSASLGLEPSTGQSHSGDDVRPDQKPKLQNCNADGIPPKFLHQLNPVNTNTQGKQGQGVGCSKAPLGWLRPIPGTACRHKERCGITHKLQNRDAIPPLPDFSTKRFLDECRSRNSGNHNWRYKAKRRQIEQDLDAPPEIWHEHT
jgi:hypothetical protein